MTIEERREAIVQAIADLHLALSQLEPDGRPCAICGDDGHLAFGCHHNPLVQMRALEALRAWALTAHESLHALAGYPVVHNALSDFLGS